jgi:hypothetical protein
MTSDELNQLLSSVKLEDVRIASDGRIVLANAAIAQQLRNVAAADARAPNDGCVNTECPWGDNKKCTNKSC